MSDRPRRSMAVTVVGAVSGGVGLAAAAATLGALLAGRWWPFDLLTSFHPQYAVLLTAAGLLHVLLRSPGPAAWLLAAALVNTSIVAPSFTGSGTDPAASGERLTVLSFNVGVSNPGRDEIAAYIAREQPQVLFVIESSFEWEDALAEHGPAMAAVAIVPRGRVSGITAMADPSLAARPVPVPFADPGEALAVEVDLGGRRLLILALHPPSPTSSERARRRDRILAAAGDWVASAGMPVLVVGDLNATRWSPAFRSLQARGGLRDTSEGSGLQPTWPAGWGPAMIPIDHALTSDGLVAVARRTGPSLGSSHRPLIVTVAAAG